MSLKGLLLSRSIYMLSLLAGMVIAGVIIFSITGCSRRTMSEEEASRWIAAYSPARLDRDSKIRIELTDQAVGRIDTLRSPEKAISFSPGLKGSARYSAEGRYIDFVPAEAMKQGQRYTCRVRMGYLTALDSLADFEFDFYVDKRQIRFEDVAAVVDPDDVSKMIVRGRLVYNSSAADSLVADSAAIICDYPGVKIMIDKASTKQGRGFTIKGIERRSEDWAMEFSVNPKIGFSKAEHRVVVPAISGFRLLEGKRIEAAEPYINLEFSTPLSSQQELDGLITIDKINSLRFERSGTNVKVYYGNNGIADLRLHISDLVKNIEGRCLDEEIEMGFAQEVIAPAIEIPFSGNILPDNRSLKLPFRAVNLAAVDVEVVKIFPSNVMAFLQENDLDGCSELRRFGRLVYHKTVRLDGDKSLDLHRWQDFSIDLKNLFARERGAVYNIRLTFRKAYSLYNKTQADDFEEVDGVSAKDNRVWDETLTWIYRDAPDMDYDKYKWDEANDPSKDTYYMIESDRMPEVNLVASNLGLIAKRGNDRGIEAVVTDLVSAEPVAGVTVNAYNFQLQKIGWGVTDKSGFADLKTEGNPFMIAASDGFSTTYLKISPENQLSTSNFDVSGTKTVNGIKGFVYGERGVWRPGDEIHLTLIVEDKDRQLPDNHPVVMELYNPNEQVYDRQTLTKGLNGFYVFHVATDENVQTGLWTAKFRVGNETFSHPVRVETIKPNRLKINISTPEIINGGQKNKIGVSGRWLTGPAAKDMAVTMDMTLYPNPTPFENYKNFTFKNPLVSYSSSQRELFMGRLDSRGEIVRECVAGSDPNAPGMLLATLTAKVSEPGGDASIVAKSVAFSPFGVYVGINPGDKVFETDREISFPVVVVNQHGARMRTRQLDYKIYRVGWDWWFEGSTNDLSRYVQSSTADVVDNGSVTAVDGMARIPFKVDYPDWGRYLILVRDAKGGHATGCIVSVDWPEWRGRSNRSNASGSTELSFNLDKPQYEVGETANLYLPKCRGGRVLLSIENGSKVIKKIWISLSGDKETKYPLLIDKSMAPNFYLSATMLRPHGATDFDTPIRLFGVRSVKVINPRSILHPEIDLPEKLHPQQPFVVKVSERDRKPMTYTLAIVDEGLLDITDFKTPQPWPAMNRKEALGITTWDMFDDVIGAFGSNFRSIMSIGGDEALRRAAGKEKRFNPAVKFIGPFTTDGSAKAHKIVLPNYVGSVRVMVVAAQNGSYGSADKTVGVTSPLMLLPTLPRTLANCDTVTVPVNVFTMEKGLRNVSVTIDATGPIRVMGSKSRSLIFNDPGEQLTDFRIVADRLQQGKGRVILTAAANGHVVRDTTFIDVFNPMPDVIETVDKTLSAGATTAFSWTPRPNGQVALQIASLPMPNFNAMALFMDSYPHLCTEQLSSRALFMLYGRSFLNPEMREKCDKALPQLIKLIQSRQRAGGGFVYWPGDVVENSWVSSMAGLALAEASRQGFRVDRDVFEKWVKYQQKLSRDYKYSLRTDLDQAFRLYSMAVGGREQTSAMNRLRESKRISRDAAYCLASAYAETGRKDVASRLVERAERAEPSTAADMFCSEIRSRAIELDALAQCGQIKKSLPTARKIVERCNGASFVTQDLAFAAIAISRLADLCGDNPLSVRVVENKQRAMSIADNGRLREVRLNPQSGRVEVTNLSSGGVLSLSLLSSYQPAADAVVSSQYKGLKMSVGYVDLKGHTLPVSSLRQDTDFKARIVVTNLGDDAEGMALTYAIPSGWEIGNRRLFDATAGSCDNCDIRDDSVKFYFGLKKGQTKTFEVRLRAVYPGNFLLPPTICEDMYIPDCQAMTTNRRCSVKR